MLTKDNNKSLFGDPKNVKIGKSKSDLYKNKNKIDELYISQENNIYKLKQFIKEQNNIVLKNKIDYDDLEKENESLQKQIDKLTIINNDFIKDELIYIDLDIFEYESNYILKKKVISYENQLDYINCFLYNNNISNFEELTKIIKFYKKNNYDYIYKKYENIFTILNNVDINFQSQKLKMSELFNNFEYLDNKIKKIKNKINTLPIGSIVKINGVKKIFRGKIENHINKIKMVQEDFDEYCNKQIQWAKSIIGNDIEDTKIIKLLDILNKLNKSYTSTKSDSEGEISDIFNEMENIEVQRYNMLFKLGNSFIKKDISDKSQIPDIIKNYKKIIYSYDSKDKINRFISTSKRMYKISILINTENIIKSKCMTSIRDMSNNSFDNLLKLLENMNKKE
jgi:hypothetical protein